MQESKIPRSSHSVPACSRTFKGPNKRKSSLLLVCNQDGAEANETILTLGCAANSGRGPVSGWIVRSVLTISIFTPTCVTHERNKAAVGRDAQGMVLHSRTAAQITEDDDLHRALLIQGISGRGLESQEEKGNCRNCHQQ